MAAKLWDGLGLMESIHHLSCVSLLHHLHNIVPHPKSIERIVARSLGYGNQVDGSSVSCGSVVDSFHKFTLFWHLSRDEAAKKGIQKTRSSLRSFDVCLLKMLDNLSASCGPLKTLSQSWLVHAMARGDVARIMEPLLITPFGSDNGQSFYIALQDRAFGYNSHRRDRPGERTKSTPSP